MTLKRFIESELAKIEPNWTAEGKGGYWWGVKIGLETVLNRTAASPANKTASTFPNSKCAKCGKTIFGRWYINPSELFCKLCRKKTL